MYVTSLLLANVNSNDSPYNHPPPPPQCTDHATWGRWFAAVYNSAIATNEVYSHRLGMARRLRDLFATDIERAMFCFRMMESNTSYNWTGRTEWLELLGTTRFLVHNQMNNVLALPPAMVQDHPEPEVVAVCDEAGLLLDQLIPQVDNRDRKDIEALRSGIGAGNPWSWRYFLAIQNRAHGGNGGMFDACGEGLYRHGPACMDEIKALAFRLLRHVLPLDA